MEHRPSWCGEPPEVSKHPPATLEWNIPMHAVYLRRPLFSVSCLSRTVASAGAQLNRPCEYSTQAWEGERICHFREELWGPRKHVCISYQSYETTAGHKQTRVCDPACLSDISAVRARPCNIASCRTGHRQRDQEDNTAATAASAAARVLSALAAIWGTPSAIWRLIPLHNDLIFQIPSDVISALPIEKDCTVAGLARPPSAAASGAAMSSAGRPTAVCCAGRS